MLENCFSIVLFS